MPRGSLVSLTLEILLWSSSGFNPLQGARIWWVQGSMSTWRQISPLSPDYVQPAQNPQHTLSKWHLAYCQDIWRPLLHICPAMDRLLSLVCIPVSSVTSHGVAICRVGTAEPGGSGWGIHWERWVESPFSLGPHFVFWSSELSGSSQFKLVFCTVRNIGACVYMCVYTHTHTHIHIYIP